MSFYLSLISVVPTLNLRNAQLKIELVESYRLFLF